MNSSAKMQKNKEPESNKAERKRRPRITAHLGGTKCLVATSYLDIASKAWKWSGCAEVTPTL